MVRRRHAKRFERYRAAYPDLGAEFTRRACGELPAEFAAVADAFVAAAAAKGEALATRKASQNALAAFARELPEMFGGSADLTHSNLTIHPLSQPITRDPAGNTIFYGVREFGMTAIANGIALHGGFLPYVATFLVFSDYACNAIRMSALMRQRVVQVFTHEILHRPRRRRPDLPAGQHVESLRLIPNLEVWRPGDAVETAAAWRAAIARKDGPTALVLSRQALPHQLRTPEQIDSDPARRLRADRTGDFAGGDHHRNRLRATAWQRRRFAAGRRRRAGPGGLDAERRGVRAAG